MTKILVLKDGRMANTNQSISLANSIGIALKGECEIHTSEAKFNFLSNFPNFLPISHLTSKIQKPLYSEYDIIIGCGRRLANAVLHAKKKYGTEKVKTIVILNPCIAFKNFDIVVLPVHDEIIASTENNVVNTIGAMSVFRKKKLEKAREEFDPMVSRFHKPFISLLVGGTSKHFTFTEKMAISIAQKANKIAKNMDATLLISTSRRTPDFFVKILTEHLDCSYYLYEFGKSKNNPYLGMLAVSDFFIITADSISMICEVSSMKKPVYIYKDGINYDKYNKFIDLILKKQSVRLIDDSVDVLKNFPHTPIDDYKQVAKECLLKLNIDF